MNIKSAKTFLKAHFRENLYPRNIPAIRYSFIVIIIAIEVGGALNLTLWQCNLD